MSYHVPSSSRLSNASCSSSSSSPRAVSLFLSAAEYGARNMHTPPAAAHRGNAIRDQMSTKTACRCYAPFDAAMISSGIRKDWPVAS